MKTIIAEAARILFKAKFVHHSAKREATETIIVRIRNQNGLEGYGESCPRSYVTAETIESALVFIEKIKSFVENLNNIDELLSFQKKISIEIDKNPSAWCAVELAMLDLFAREEKVSVEHLLGVNADVDQEKFSAVIGIDSFPMFFTKLLIYKAMGFSDFKIKLSGDKSLDLKNLKFLSFFTKNIRVDANNLFDDSLSAIEYLKTFSHFIWAIEEPVKSHSITEMKEIALALGVKIILDESFLNESSLEQISGNQDIFIPNLRISKLGGVTRTWALVESLEKGGFQWILGSHVGEMSLLTRASFFIARKDLQGLIAKEGGFSTHLLKYDPFFPNLKLGIGAKIKRYPFQKSSGWGMEYKEKNEEI